MLTLLLDGVAAGEGIALDIDSCFFADAPASADGMARFAFAFSPDARTLAHLLPRLHRDGEPLASDPLVIRFGTPGIEATVAADVAVDRKSVV